ncbi:hypothetical protein B0H10DRAFT_1950514 [Mycena sp. CBHHK59/15]|nr:hypothetical protein B0H10DRAFT_1950514 [Mycena sp. CBHHK59/15]
MDDHHSQCPPQIGLKLFRMLTSIDTHLVACRVHVAAIQASCRCRGRVRDHEFALDRCSIVNYMVYMCGVRKDSTSEMWPGRGIRGCHTCARMNTTSRWPTDMTQWASVTLTCKDTVGAHQCHACGLPVRNRRVRAADHAGAA